MRVSADVLPPTMPSTVNVNYASHLAENVPDQPPTASTAFKASPSTQQPNPDVPEPTHANSVSTKTGIKSARESALTTSSTTRQPAW